MYLKNLANVIYEQDTESENTKIKVINQNADKLLWEGLAKDLASWDKIDGWLVFEVLVDRSDDSTEVLHNKGKIIRVY